MRTIAAALLASVTLAAPAQAADLNFVFSTTASGPAVYISGSGKLTINEASGVGGRYDVTGVSGNYVAGILRGDNTLASRSDGPLTVVRSDSFVSFASDGTVLDYHIDLTNAGGQIEIGLFYLGGNSHVAMTVLGIHVAAISIEGFVPPLAPPVAPPPAPPPIFQPGAVPELSTWALMLAGFGLVGTGLRSRKQARITFA